MFSWLKNIFSKKAETINAETINATPTEVPKEEKKEEAIETKPSSYKENLYKFYIEHREQTVYSKSENDTLYSIKVLGDYEFSKDAYFEGFNALVSFVCNEHWEKKNIKLKVIGGCKIYGDDFSIPIHNFLDITEDEFLEDGNKKIAAYIENFKAIPIGATGWELKRPRGLTDGYVVVYKIVRKLIDNGRCYVEMQKKRSNEDVWSKPYIEDWSSIVDIFEKPDPEYIDPEFNFE